VRHAAALGFDVDLQATEKARALLGKQRHKPRIYLPFIGVKYVRSIPL
jgi:hypothetical protein